VLELKKKTKHKKNPKMGQKKRKKEKTNQTGDLFCHHFSDFLFYLTACSVKPTFLVKDIYCFVDNKVCKKKKKPNPQNQPPTIVEVASVVHLLLSWLCYCCSVCV